MFKRPAGLRSTLMLACAAFTSDDLPMPRAPHSSTLLAGRPSAKRSVFWMRMSRTRSIPLSRPMSTRLTRGTGTSRPFGCQMKALALPSESPPPAAGDAADRWEAMVSSARTILSVVSYSEAPAGRFVAVGDDFRAARGLVFWGFFDICGVPDHAALSGLLAARQPLQ